MHTQHVDELLAPNRVCFFVCCFSHYYLQFRAQKATIESLLIYRELLVDHAHRPGMIVSRNDPQFPHPNCRLEELCSRITTDWGSGRHEVSTRTFAGPDSGLVAIKCAGGE
jgi:hypothetical protein